MSMLRKLVCVREARRILLPPHYNNIFRCTSSQPAAAVINNSWVMEKENENPIAAADMQPVKVENTDSCRTVILNRPHALNALNTQMGIRMSRLYKSWENDPDVSLIILKGAGRAFSAGGDVVDAYNLINKGRIEECKLLFSTYYRFMHMLASSLKPQVALMDGITIGGAAGISICGSFRIATDNTALAFPEIHAGLHPDGGASYYLSHLPGYLGEYLALTGDFLNGRDLISCGLATHYIHSKRLDLVEEQLKETKNNKTRFSIESILRRNGDPILSQSRINNQRRILIDKCFGYSTVEEIIDALEKAAAETADPWCKSTLKTLKSAPPLGLKVSLRSIREGRNQTFEECLTREYRMTVQAISRNISTDFCEGVRARLVDKCFKPKWDPPCLEQVSDDMVESYFSQNISELDRLQLPAKCENKFAHELFYV